MLTIILIVGAVIGVILLIKNNKKKAAKVENIVDKFVKEVKEKVEEIRKKD